jgi:hypothetical protein
MFNKLFNLKVFITLAFLAVLVGAALAQSDSPNAPQAPDAVRIRLAHLASFNGSSTDNLTVTINGTPFGGPLKYGDKIDYQTMSAGAGIYTIDVLRNGNPFITGAAYNLVDGDHTLVIIGNLEDTIFPQVWHFSDVVTPPDIGKTKLRVAHVASLGNTLAGTKVDVCSQDGLPFTPTGNGLTYRLATIFVTLNPNTYNLRVPRWVDGAPTPCTGPTIIDPIPLTLSDGDLITLFLVGDNKYQEAQVFSFELGMIPNEDITEPTPTATVPGPTPTATVPPTVGPTLTPTATIDPGTLNEFSYIPAIFK